MLGSVSNKKFRYKNGFRPLAFAVSMILKQIPLAVAPLGDFANKKFFLANTKGLIHLSDNYLHIRITNIIHRIFLSSSFVKKRLKSNFFSLNMWINISLFMIMESPIQGGGSLWNNMREILLL